MEPSPQIVFGRIYLTTHCHPYRNPTKASISTRYNDPTQQTFGCDYKYVFAANCFKGHCISQETGAAYVFSGRWQPPWYQYIIWWWTCTLGWVWFSSKGLLGSSRRDSTCRYSSNSTGSSRLPKWLTIYDQGWWYDEIQGWWNQECCTMLNGGAR